MTTSTTTTSTDLGLGSRDEAELAGIPMQMIDAWNRGDSDGFAAPFTDDADLVAFEGTHVRGRATIATFHRDLFATVVKGTRLEGGVRFVRVVAPEVAVIHSWVRYLNLPGVEPATAGRLSMQLFVAVKRDGRWRAAAVQNSRELTIEQEQVLDELAAREASA